MADAIISEEIVLHFGISMRACVCLRLRNDTVAVFTHSRIVYAST